MNISYQLAANAFDPAELVRQAVLAEEGEAASAWCMSDSERGIRPSEVIVMGPLLVVLLLALLLFGGGFALHLLWWIAVIVLIVWVLGFVMRGTHSSGGRNRWYRW